MMCHLRFFRLESMGIVTLKPVTDQSSELYMGNGLYTKRIYIIKKYNVRRFDVRVAA